VSDSTPSKRERKREARDERQRAAAAQQQRTRWITVAAVVLVIALIGIGAAIVVNATGGDDSADGGTPAATAGTGDQSKVPAVTGAAGERPKVAKPNGAPPTELVVKDLKVGTGEQVTDLTTPWLWNYEGVSWSDGETFDSSFSRGEAIPFALQQVIPCWQQGLEGMQVGGRRVLVCPPDLAYGEQGQGAIKPNETLVFVVDLVGPAPAGQ
jgi:peptidylprolyl isomerase